MRDKETSTNIQNNLNNAIRINESAFSTTNALWRHIHNELQNQRFEGMQAIRISIIRLPVSRCNPGNWILLCRDTPPNQMSSSVSFEGMDNLRDELRWGRLPPVYQKFLGPALPACLKRLDT